MAICPNDSPDDSSEQYQPRTTRGYGEKIIQSNEDTYYTGNPYNRVFKGGSKKLPEIQKLIFNGETTKAHKLFGRTMMG